MDASRIADLRHCKRAFTKIHDRGGIMPSVMPKVPQTSIIAAFCFEVKCLRLLTEMRPLPIISDNMEYLLY